MQVGAVIQEQKLALSSVNCLLKQKTNKKNQDVLGGIDDPELPICSENNLTFSQHKETGRCDPFSREI